MRLCIARHGHKASKLPDYDGGPNTPLSERGHRQAEHLADFLVDEEEIDYLYSSCQLRSLQTAEPIHDRLGERWHVWPVFQEARQQRWDEQHAENPDDVEWTTAWRAGEELETPSPEEIESMDGNYYLLSDIPEMFPGTELTQPFPFPDAWWKAKRLGSAELGYARADLGLQALLQRHESDDNVAIICHGTIADMLVTSLKEFPRTQRHFSCKNAGVHRLDRWREEYWRMTYANNASYLPDDLVR